MNSNETNNPLCASERVVVYPAYHHSGTTELVVVIPPGAPRTTHAYPGCADDVVRSYPNIVRHRCASGSAHGIRAELAQTEVAHLIEHVVIEQLVQRGIPRAGLSGETAWDFQRDGQGVYRVRIHGCRDVNEVHCAVGVACDLIEQFTAV